MAEVLIGGFIEGLRPDPVMTVTEWAEAKRMLSSKGSAEPGPYRVVRTPYLRKIMDVMSVRSRLKKAVVKKASQLGLTEAAFNVIGYYIDQVPCAMMYLMPTVDTMERNVKQRIDPMIEESPSLKGKIGAKRSKDGGNTLGQKDYPGGALFLVGANSASALASIPVMVALLDEVDRYPQDVDDEGSPISLVERRQMTFPKRKNMLFGTPTIEGASKTEAEYMLTDQQCYMVPCVHCMKLQVLQFEQLRWVKGNYKEVHYECIHCSKWLYNRDKNFMLVEDKSEYIPGAKDEGRARWVATRPELADPELMGFDVGGMYSPDGWLSWEDMAKEWDNCEGDEPRKKSFFNTMLGRTYRTRGIAPGWQMLYERAQADGLERNMVWESVGLITAGADVQPDRIEVMIMGWMKGRVKQVIDYRVIVGDTTKADVWEKMDVIMEEVWELPPPPSGTPPKTGGEFSRSMNIRLMAIDANFNSDFVHAFSRKWGIRRVVPIQGREKLEMPFSTPKVVTKTKLGKKTPKGKVWPVGVSYLKELVYGWLRLEIGGSGAKSGSEVGETGMEGVVPNGFCHFLPMDEAWFRGITAEERVPVRNKKTNAIKYEWVKRYERNEPLDTMVYATAAFFVVGADRWGDKKWGNSAGGTVRSAKVNAVVGSDERRVMEEDVPVARDGSEAEKVQMEQQKAEKPGKKRRGGSFWGR